MSNSNELEAIKEYFHGYNTCLDDIEQGGLELALVAYMLELTGTGAYARGYRDALCRVICNR